MARTPELKRVGLLENSTGQGLFLVTLALLAVGVVMVHSALASVAHPGRWYARMDVRHTLFAGLALLVLVIAWRVDYRFLAAGGRLPVWSALFLVISLVCGSRSVAEHEKSEDEDQRCSCWFHYSSIMAGLRTTHHGDYTTGSSANKGQQASLRPSRSRSS